MSDLKLVTLYEHSLVDVPAMLRNLATAIEQGEHGIVRVALCILEKENAEEPMSIFGWGDNSSAVRDIGLLQCAITSLVNTALANAEDGNVTART